MATIVAKETEEAEVIEDTPFCIVDLPESWRAALAQGKISVPDTVRLGVLAVAADGSRIFGGLYSVEWSGIVSVDRDGSIARIRASRSGSTGGAFDGRWLVWEESHSSTDWSDWDIWAWDSNSGEVFEVATAPRANGATVPGPFVIPAVSDGKSAWVQANQSGKGEVHLYDLATRQDRVLSAGAVVPPVLLQCGP